MYPIPSSFGMNPWEVYQSYGDGGYKKFIYLCRNGTDWYDGSILKADGLTIDRFCTASSFLEMGNVNAAACSFVLTAPPLDITSWDIGDEIEVQIDPTDRTTISTPSADVVKMGIFVIDSINERQGVYTIDCLDRMVYLDVEMDWTGFSTNYPITTVLSNIATQCGITLANSISGFPNASIGWYTNPAMTCRQVVSAIAEVIGANAYMDWNGELRFGWYEPAKDSNNLYVQIGDNIAVSRYTAPRYYALKNYEIGSPDEPQTDVSGTDVTYRLIANPLVEGARDYINVDTIAAAITAARYTAVSSKPAYYQFNGGDYTVLPFPYIWPMDVLGTPTADIPITHVTYKLNGNMILGSSVEPRVPQANTFTSPQQTIINNMQEATEEINRHFFYANATGAHITTVENDPDSGNNVLIDSNGLYVRNDTDVLASFDANGATFDATGSQKMRIVNSAAHGTQIMAEGDNANTEVYIVADDKTVTTDGNECGMYWHLAPGVATLASINRDANGQSVYGKYGLEEEVINAAGDSSNGWDVTIADRLSVIGINGSDAGSITAEGKITAEGGSITISDAYSVNAYEQLTFYNAGDITPGPYSGSYIRSYDVDANGSDMIVRSGGRFIAGGGEYASNRYNAGSFEGAEATWIGSDSAVFIESNGNTISSRNKWTFSASGDLIAPNGAVYEAAYKSETVTLTSANLIGNGYAGASSIYIELPLPKKISEGSNVSLTTFTAGLRGVSGTIAANGTNLLTNTTAARSGAGGLRLTITGQTTNFTANTPVSAVVSNITVEIS